MKWIDWGRIPHVPTVFLPLLAHLWGAGAVTGPQQPSLLVNCLSPSCFLVWILNMQTVDPLLNGPLWEGCWSRAGRKAVHYQEQSQPPGLVWLQGKVYLPLRFEALLLISTLKGLRNKGFLPFKVHLQQRALLVPWEAASRGEVDVPPVPALQDWEHHFVAWRRKHFKRRKICLYSPFLHLIWEGGPGLVWEWEIISV